MCIMWRKYLLPWVAIGLCAAAAFITESMPLAILAAGLVFAFIRPVHND